MCARINTWVPGGDSPNRKLVRVALLFPYMDSGRPSFECQVLIQMIMGGLCLLVDFEEDPTPETEKGPELFRFPVEHPPTSIC